MALLLGTRDEALTEQEKNDLLALDALREASVAELKEQGNAYVRQGRAHYGDALDCYTRAINQKIDQPLQNSVLFSNRAYVNLMLGNYRRALNDAKDSLKCDPCNVKAYFRGAKAAFSLDIVDEALQLCMKGLEKDSSNAELVSLKNQVETRSKELAERKQWSKKGKKLIAAFEQRQVKLGPSLYNELSGGKKPWLDSANVLHWPVVFLYGEVMGSDLIEDFSEFDKLKAHLDTMFADSSPPWDAKHEYTRDQIELYYQANGIPPLSKRELAKLLGVEDNKDLEEDENDVKYTYASKSWKKIDEDSTLRTVLSKPDHIVPGIPVFYVVAAGSQFKETFLSGTWSPP